MTNKQDYKSAARPNSIEEVRTHAHNVTGKSLRLSVEHEGRHVLRVNHYYSKSKSEFKEKMQRGWPMGSRQDLGRKLARQKSVNADTVNDESIFGFLTALHAACEG